MADAKNLLTFVGFSILELILLYYILVIWGYTGFSGIFFILLVSIISLAVGSYLTIFKDNGRVLLITLILGTVLVAGEFNIDFTGLNTFVIGFSTSILFLYFGSISTLLVKFSKNEKNPKEISEGIGED